MSKAELIRAHSRASQLKCLIGELSKSLDKLKQETAKKICQEEEKKLKFENEKLKSEVVQLRSKLCELEMKHNKKQVSLPVNLNSSKILPTVEKMKIEPQAKSVSSEIKENNRDKNIANKAEKKPAVKQEQKVAAAADDVVDASRLNMRIGRIINVSKHPDADSLYVETVDLGESKPRTIVSGLVNHVPIEQMNNRTAVFLINLKPAKMRGVLSEGMIMCASTPEKVEIILVPDGVVIGERVIIEGYEGPPDEQLNAKKKKVPTATLR